MAASSTVDSVIRWLFIFEFYVLTLLILWYNFFVSRKSLIETNPYLRDPDKFEKSLTANVATSTAIELGTLPDYIILALEKDADPQEFIKTPVESKKSSRSPI